VIFMIDQNFAITFQKIIKQQQGIKVYL